MQGNNETTGAPRRDAARPARGHRDVAVKSELTPELIRLAYRLFLGREAENDIVVGQAMNYGTLPALRAAFLDGAEFRGIFAPAKAPAPALVPIGAPPIEVEWEIDAATAETLLGHVRRTWTKLGEERPHWSVLSSAAFTPEEIEKNEIAFFASGVRDSGDLVAVLKRQGLAPGDVPRAFEFGCGVGRVTPHLARVFAQVTVCDVSASHMAMAKDTVARSGVDNITFNLVESAEFGMLAPFDVWFSRIVLQHNSPPIIAMILRRALTLLAPGGIAVFQVPTYALGYRFRLADYLKGLNGAGTGSGNIEMHVLPQPVVFAIARDCGCEPLEVLEDMSAGPSASWTSTTFVVRKAKR